MSWVDPHEDVRLSFAGPGEIKGKEEVVRDPQESPGERTRARGGARLRKLDLSFASVVSQQLCYGHCPCDSAPHGS